jgi:hypothetical protein
MKIQRPPPTLRGKKKDEFCSNSLKTERTRKECLAAEVVKSRKKKGTIKRAANCIRVAGYTHTDSS